MPEDKIVQPDLNKDNPNLSQDVNLDAKNTADKTVVIPDEGKTVTPPVDDKNKLPDVNFDDFLKATGETSLLETGEQKKPDEKKVDDKVEDKVVTREEKVKQDQSTRSYEGIEEADIPLFKEMSRASFDKLRPVYLEHKKQMAEIAEKNSKIEALAKNAIPENYWSHPRGYTLTPDFEKVANISIKANQIVQHWQDQLAKVKEGEETFETLHIDPKTGEFYTTATKTEKESEKQIEAYINGSEQQLRKFQTQLEEMAKTHLTKHSDAIKQLTDFENTAFKVFTDEKVKDKLAPLVKDTIEKSLHPVFHNNPLAPLIAKALITINQIGTEYKKLKESGIKLPDKTSDDKTKLNPNLNDMGGGGGAPDKNGTPKYEDFLAAMGGDRT